jgi:hypothetical protein
MCDKHSLRVKFLYSGYTYANEQEFKEIREYLKEQQHERDKREHKVR